MPEPRSFWARLAARREARKRRREERLSRLPAERSRELEAETQTLRKQNRIAGHN